MDQQTDSWSAVALFLLNALTIGWTAAEPGRKHLCEDLYHVRIQEGHPSGGELLEAPNRMEMGGPAELLEQTAAVALGEHSLVAK